MKEIYARLCRPNPFDDGAKEIWLDKNTGRVCLSIYAKALSVVVFSHITLPRRRHICSCNNLVVIVAALFGKTSTIPLIRIPFPLPFAFITIFILSLSAV